MNRQKVFNPEAGIASNHAKALFGKFASDPLARRLFSTIALWPETPEMLADNLGNFANVVKTTAKYSGGRTKRIVEARIHPAIDRLLEILVPALCQRDSTAFRLIADVIDAVKYGGMPAHRNHFNTLCVACALVGETPPTNPFGEATQPDEEMESVRSGLNVPISFSEFQRLVEQRLQLLEPMNPGTFKRICDDLNITCAKRQRSGGRPTANA